jgi:hypothetical protein
MMIRVHTFYIDRNASFGLSLWSDYYCCCFLSLSLSLFFLLFSFIPFHHHSLLQELGLTDEPHGRELTQTECQDHHFPGWGTRRQLQRNNIRGGFQHEIKCGTAGIQKTPVITTSTDLKVGPQQTNEHVETQTLVFVPRVTEQVEYSDMLTGPECIKTQPNGQYFKDLGNETFRTHVGNDFGIEFTGRPVQQSG